MSRLILFHKPFGVICQFSAHEKHATLKDYVPIADVYPAGRLDTDSEGLVILTDDGALQHRIADPRHKLPKTYWVQVEGIPDPAAISALCAGVDVRDYVTLPAQARPIPEPQALWPRDPPIRFRKALPTSWIELTIREGKNRQVRRMTAAVGCPTLRLIRWSVGPWTLEGLAPGQWREVEEPSAALEQAGRPRRRRDGSRHSGRRQ
jgi:23S rRNA pseudouridine2457 synthase